MSCKEQNNELIGKVLNFESLQKDLNNTSPLQMSKKLIEYELYEQEDTLEVLDKICKDFDQNGVFDSLITPLLFNIIDGLMKHPKLKFARSKDDKENKSKSKNEFDKMGISASKLYYEVHQFTYEDWIIKKIYQDDSLNQAQKFHYSSWLRKTFYDTKSRDKTRKEKELSHEDINGMDMDHVNPINYLRNLYKNNPYLYREDIANIVQLPVNEEYINSSLNRSKGDKTWSQYIQDAPKDEHGNILDSKGDILLTSDEQKNKLELEKEAKEIQQKEAAKMMAKNIGLLALGDIIIMILKPIWFELKEVFTKGVLFGFEDKTDKKSEAIVLRFERVKAYIIDNIIPLVEDRFKDTMENFVGIIISMSIDFFKGILQKAIRIISDGFLAIKEAFKVMVKDTDEFGNKITASQKADAITKIVVTALVPLLIFSFEETLSSLPLIGDVATIIVSGLLTTVVIWAIDQLDIFSVKDDKRTARVQEIFKLRVENIKKNTDMFEKASLEKLAKQKLHFKKIAEEIQNAVDKNLDVNSTVYDIADFMKVELKVKSTEDFLYLLTTNQKLEI